jgi:hypothetical protein
MAVRKRPPRLQVLPDLLIHTGLQPGVNANDI